MVEKNTETCDLHNVILQEYEKQVRNNRNDQLSGKFLRINFHLSLGTKQFEEKA